MPRDTFNALMGQGEHLLVTIQANSTDLAHLEETRLQLVGALDVAKAASVRQDTVKALVQQATRDLEKAMADAQELVTRLRNGIRTKYGLRSEKLTEFGMQPRRAPGKKAAKVKPAPVPQPAPALVTTAAESEV
jgi:DNA-binding protein H-NS